MQLDLSMGSCLGAEAIPFIQGTPIFGTPFFKEPRSNELGSPESTGHHNESVIDIWEDDRPYF